MRGVADGLRALGDLLALLRKALVLPAGRFKGLLGLCKAHRGLWGAAWPALAAVRLRLPGALAPAQVAPLPR